MMLTWAQVDYTRALAFPSRTKNGKGRQVPLTSAALCAISAMPRYGKTVFYHPTTLKPWNPSTIRYRWKAARKKAESALRIHDLRHAYAIKLAESNCAMHYISEVLGHHSIDFTRKRYVRFSPDSASRAVLRVLEAVKG